MTMQGDTTSNAPDDCPDCGKRWSHTECVHTGDPAGIDGWEDWCYCSACKCELFYPLLPAVVAAPAVEAFVAECFAGPTPDEWRAMQARGTA